MELFFKALSFIPKLLALAQPKIERTQWVIALCKEMGIDILKADFESIYAYALVEYRLDNPEKTLWVEFFSLKATAEHIKIHLYQKPENELVTNFDTLLHTGQGGIFLQLKKENIQTEDVQKEYEVLKKYIVLYTEKSKAKNLALAENTELSHEILQKLAEIKKDDSQFEKVLERIDWQGQTILTELETIKESLSRNQAFLGILAQKISEANLSEAQNIQIADKIYNFERADHSTFNQSGNITNYFYSQKLNTHPLYLWVISTTKENIGWEKEFLPQFPLNRYHETDCTLWKPFENEETISELIAEYKTEVEFEVRERFLAKNPIVEDERAIFLKNKDKIVLVVDPFALHDEQLKTAKKFDDDKIGACLVLLCQSVSFELFAYIRNQIETVFGDLRTCFLDYKEKYLHFIFPIPTKELFFRTLSNIAFLRLEIGTEIEGGNQKVKNKTFKF